MNRVDHLTTDAPIESHLSSIPLSGLLQCAQQARHQSASISPSRTSAPPSRQAHLDAELHVVGEDERAEGQAVRADGREQDAGHLQR